MKNQPDHERARKALELLKKEREVSQGKMVLNNHNHPAAKAASCSWSGEL